VWRTVSDNSAITSTTVKSARSIMGAVRTTQSGEDHRYSFKMNETESHSCRNDMHTTVPCAV